MKKRDLIVIGLITALLGYLTLTKSGKNMFNKISENGLNFLKSVEGFSSKAYYDVKGWSIGFGHFMGANKLENNITLERGLELLKNDLNWVERAIANRVTVSLTQNQHDALVSFIYNLGEPNFASSTLLKKINDKDFIGASNEFKKWNNKRVNGVLINDMALTDRREKERRLFLS